MARKKRVFPLTFAYMKQEKASEYTGKKLDVWYNIVGKSWLSAHDKKGNLTRPYWDNEYKRDVKRFERAWKKEEAKERKWYSRDNW